MTQPVGPAVADPAAYDALVDQIEAADSRDALAACVPGIEHYPQAEVRGEFARVWFIRWQQVTGEPGLPVDLWGRP